MSCSKYDLTKFILHSLSLADPCAGDILTPATLNDIWSIEQHLYPCDKATIASAVKLRAIEILMTCDVNAFDYKDTSHDGSNTSESKSRADTRSHDQSSGSGTTRSDTCATGFYDDYSRMKSTRGSQRDMAACSHDHSFSRGIDRGRGRMKNIHQAKREGNSWDFTHSHSDSLGTTRGSGVRVGCDKTFNADESKGGTYGNTSGASSDPSIFGWITGNAPASTYQKSVGDSADGSRTVYQHTMFSGNADRQTDKRDGASDRTYQNRGFARNKAGSESCDYFNNAKFSISRHHWRGERHDNSQATHNEWAASQGFGEDRATQVSRQESSGQSTKHGHADSEASRGSRMTAQTSADAAWRSQRFKNLKLLHDRSDWDLQELLKGARANLGWLTSERVDCLIAEGFCELAWFDKSQADWRCQAKQPHEVYGNCAFTGRATKCR